MQPHPEDRKNPRREDAAAVELGGRDTAMLLEPKLERPQRARPPITTVGRQASIMHPPGVTRQSLHIQRGIVDGRGDRGERCDGAPSHPDGSATRTLRGRWCDGAPTSPLGLGLRRFGHPRMAAIRDAGDPQRQETKCLNTKAVVSAQVGRGSLLQKLLLLCVAVGDGLRS